MGREWTREQRAALLEAALEGRSYADLAREHGVSRQRIAQLLRDERRRLRRAAETLAARDLEQAALQVRHQQALAVAELVEVWQRPVLLSYVVWPSAAVAEASRARALQGDAAVDVEASCAGCGCPSSQYTLDCPTCAGRRDGRAKRERQRAARHRRRRG